MSYDFDQQPQGLSDGAKIAIGCGAAAFLCFILICGGAVMLGFRAVDVAKNAAKEFQAEIQRQQVERRQQADEYAAQFEADGYVRVNAQMLDVSNVVHQPTVYTAQVLNLHADSEASIAVHAQMVDIQGTINGDLHIRADVVNIHPETVITGNLYLEDTHVVDNKGTVQGEIIHEDSQADEGSETGEVDAPDLNAKPSPGDVIEKSSIEDAEKSPVDKKDADEAASPPPDAETATSSQSSN